MNATQAHSQWNTAKREGLGQAQGLYQPDKSSGQVSVEIDRMEKAIAVLSEATAQLGNRLGPALRLDGPQPNEKDKPCDQPVLVQVAQRISDLQEAVNKISKTIIDLTSRVEL